MSVFSPQRGSDMSAQGNALVVLHKSVASIFAARTIHASHECAVRSCCSCAIVVGTVALCWHVIAIGIFALCLYVVVIGTVALCLYVVVTDIIALVLCSRYWYCGLVSLDRHHCSHHWHCCPLSVCSRRWYCCPSPAATSQATRWLRSENCASAISL